jgi:uncharacterized protein (TIGR03790 family)
VYVRLYYCELRSLLASALLSLISATALHVEAGGSGLNTVVVVNQNSAQSCELGNYFCERRQVPPDNVLYINWAGGNTSWGSGDLQTNLVTPLLAMLAARQLTSQIDYVVLSMDIPFQTVYDTNKINGTTSALFYGLKDDTGPNWMDVTNSYAASSEQIFRQAQPASAPGYSFLTTMLTAGSLAQAELLVDQGVASDSTFPAQPVILAKTSDAVRNVRYHEFDNAIFNAQILNNCVLLRTNADSPWGQTNLMGYQTGLACFSVSSNTFVPGAIADSLTSYGGIIFGPNSQTSLLAFINAGAAGSYGTVTEPSANPQKFPDPQDYFYQSRGFSLAECYYQSLYAPYQGLVVGEPLAAPFALTASGGWTGVATNAILSGTVQLGADFSAGDASHPLQQIDLFIDGRYFQTLTNCAPRPGNLLSVTLNGFPLTYTVPTNATLAMVANDLATLLNAPATTNLTQVAAFAHGDRVELHSLATNGLAASFYFTDGATTNPAGRYYSAQYVPSLLPPLLTSPCRNSDCTFHLHLETPAGVVGCVQASTDLVAWLPIFTNLLGGPVDFVDAAASGYSRRFYRIVATVPDLRPQLTSLGFNQGAGFKLHVSTASALPYIVLTSTNLVNWTPIYTNSSGGTVDIIDTQATNIARRFYRTQILPQNPAPVLTVQNSTNASGLLVQVQGAAQSCIILESTNQTQWTPVFTNSAVGEVQTAVGSSAGSANALTTFLTASRSTFLDSSANGLRNFIVTGTIAMGAWLQISVTKTNGAVLSLSVTNQSSNAALFDLAQQLVTAINSYPALQGSDGLVAEDLSAGAFGTAGFNLYAGSPGLGAAAIQAQLTSSAGVGTSPSAPMSLNANLSDLQSRNHLYVTAGSSNLAVTFPFSTTGLADGFHELAAVAYEGSDVRTQTRIILPIQIHNSPLSASMTLLDLASTAPVQGIYHIQVAANTNSVSAISLYSTGGLLTTVTNQSTTTFTIDGTVLGAGLHPFYAQVQTAGGGQYRTQVQWVRLLDPQ